MARWFRLWGKKRGHRRTGSKLLGSVGEALFFAVLFVAGSIAMVVLLVSLVLRAWPASRYFPEAHFRQTTCVIREVRLVGRVDPNSEPGFRPEIRITYEVGDEQYDLWTDLDGGDLADRQESEAIVDRAVVGHTAPCWYDPDNAATVVFQRASRWKLWLLLSVLVSLIAIGGGGVILPVLQAGTSIERRASLAKRAADIELIGDAMPSPKEFPNVPHDANLTNSPGITLEYRLPIADSPVWKLVAAALLCLLWNGPVAVFVVLVVDRYGSGRPDWFLTLFIIPFVAVGLWLIRYFLRQLLVTTGIGPTSMEISDHPLYPGGEYEIFLTQSGRLSVNSLEVLLVCEEEAVYRQGTDVRTDTRRVHQQRIVRRQGIEIKPAKAFEHRCAFQMPRDMMHSFHSDHNAVHWKLVVKGDVAVWPDYERNFPIVVHPAANGELET